MRILDRDAIPVEERYEKSVERLISHVTRPYLGNRQLQHARAWAMEAAHSVFEMHPELREEGSLPRYFVAKEARKQGLRGSAVTAFVDREYAAGTWWKLVPEDVLLGKPKASVK